jgi:uncharacterized glyoxalase superfamily protein PhnB
MPQLCINEKLMNKLVFIPLIVSLSVKSQPQTGKNIVMKDSAHVTTFAASLQEVYTVFITTDVKKCKAFYAEWFGFTTLFESSWFLLLQSPGSKGFAMGFMHEEHPSSPPAPRAMKGDAAFITLQVADAKKVYDAMIAAGKKIDYHLKDEDWGQRRFAITDPNGMHVDVVEQTEPKAGYWDKYID